MSLVAQGDGRTPISAEEISELVPNLSTQEELNEWERENILEAYEWALSARTLKNTDPIQEEFIRKLHQRMFGETWRWAGKYRKTERNMGIAVPKILESIGVLIGDAQYWVKEKTFSTDEIAVRIHHRLVSIHPFPNGNGRCARLWADIIAVKWGGKPFTWGSGNIVSIGTARENYIKALQSADKGDVQPLLLFARS
jgi:Fic-DOC domain mobile mystery protein B